MTDFQHDYNRCSWWVAQKFQLAAAKVLAEESRVRVQVGYWQTRDIYPVSVYLSLGCWDPQKDEILVVSFQVWQGDGIRRSSCDILVDNYLIFAEMPVSEFPAGSDSDEFPTWLGSVAENAVAWVDSRIPYIVSIVKEHAFLFADEQLSCSESDKGERVSN